MSSHTYTDAQLVEQRVIGLFAALGWQRVSARLTLFRSDLELSVFEKLGQVTQQEELYPQITQIDPNSISICTGAITMQTNPVVHFEIYVADMTRAKAFYEAVFETKLEEMPNPTPEVEMEMWFFPLDREAGMSRYGTGGALIKMDGFSPGGGGTLVYFACEDCAIQATRAAKHGGSIVQEKQSIGDHGFCALARDTEGNLIGFHSMK